MKTTILAAALLAGTAITAQADEVYGRPIFFHENDCVIREINSDISARMHFKGEISRDPIKACDVPDDNIPAAMDYLVWSSTRGSMTTWVENNCKAEAAIPRNKWVCTYNDVTREYR
jgi:hypothetical protein